MSVNFIQNYAEEIFKLTKKINTKDFASAVNFLDSVKRSGSKVVIAGNGGSAAMASHVSVDFTKTCGLRSINFNEADLITCFSNDYGYENWLSEALAAYADKNDLIILISSSGASPNILKAAKHCNDNFLNLITFSGFSEENPLKKMGNLNFWVDSSRYNFVEMVHHIWLLALVDKLAFGDETL